MTQPFTALCCDCGTARTLKSTRSFSDDDVHGEVNGTAAVGERCILRRKCQTCRSVTRHAFLRNDPRRDYAEERQVALDLLYRARIEGAVDDLEALGVDVRVYDDGPDTGTVAATIFHDLEANRYAVLINGRRPLRQVACAAAAAYQDLLTEAPDGRWFVNPASDGSPALAFRVLSYDD